MGTVGSILIAVLMFGLLVFVHELGHFLAAKWAGVRVNEFALGMGPALLRFDRGETRYAIRLFPIGGFVALDGDNELASGGLAALEGGESTDPKAFGNAKLYKRVIIMAAGAAMNLALGLVLVFYLSTQQNLFGTTVIANFEENAATSRWLQEGDELLRMNNHRVNTSNDMIYELTRDRDGIMDIEVLRGGERLLLRDVAFGMEETDGVSIIHLDFKVLGVQPSLPSTLRHTGNWTVSIVKQVWGSLVDLLTGRFGFHQMSGPVGITQQIGEVTASRNWDNLILFVAFITVNLGVFNLLPIPALDGGRLLFLLVELIRRKPVNPKYEGYVHAAGFVLLIGMMIAVTFNDIVKLF
jgi:regulator of sigma E protease